MDPMIHEIILAVIAASLLVVAVVSVLLYRSFMNQDFWRQFRKKVNAAPFTGPVLGSVVAETEDLIDHKEFGELESRREAEARYEIQRSSDES